MLLLILRNQPNLKQMENAAPKLDVAETKPDGDDIFNKFQTFDALKEA